jgi:uncharacterized cofD-like protein
MTLIVRYADGSIGRGESTVREAGRAVSAVSAEPPGAAAPVAALKAVRRADMIVLSAGSLFTSTIAAVLGGGVREALAAFAGPVVYVANLMTQPGETAGYTLCDHLQAIARHVGPVVTDVLVDSGLPAGRLLRRYGEEGAEPVRVDRAAVERLGVRVHEAALHAEGPECELRHDPARLAQALQALAGDRRRGTDDVRPSVR